MCLLKVKEEEDYSVPTRVTKVRRIRRSPSPPRTVRVSRRSIIEERRPEPSPSRLPPVLAPHPPSPRPETRIVEPSQTATSAFTKSERRVSREPSRARSGRSRTRSAYVEVDRDTSSSSSSSDARSRRTGHTQMSRRSKATGPASVYSLHEQETRRERAYSRPKPEYETYQYVDAPRDRSRSRGPRNSFYDQPRASRDSQRRERIVTEDDYIRTRREYRP